jgi:hypothetical protein
MENLKALLLELHNFNFVLKGRKGGETSMSFQITMEILIAQLDSAIYGD